MKQQQAIPKNGQEGSFLVAAIVMILFFTAIGVSVGQLAALQYQHTVRGVYAQNAELVAEAGIEQSVEQLNGNDAFAGFSSPQQLFNNTTQGVGTFTSTVTTNADGKSKSITSTGKVYRTANDTSAYITRKIAVIVAGTTSSGYSVATGPGGLILGGSASITNSNVYVNGTITLNGSSSIGTQQNPVTVDAGNDACPTGSNPGSTYPTVCTDGSQPINLASSSHIWGSVCATGQTSTGPNNNIQGGNGGQGLEVGCTAPSVAQPTYNRSAIISGITTTVSGTSGSYACSGNKTIVLPANTELTGSTITWANSCKIVVSGNVYIPGNLSIGGSCQISVNSTVGTTRPIIAIDGSMIAAGSASMAANSLGTGMDFVSFANSTGDPAATPTGTNLYNSQTIQNIIIGGATTTPGMVFDAYWSEVVIEGSGNIGAAAGQTVYLNGAGSVVFGTTLQSGSKTWTITSYQLLPST